MGELWHMLRVLCEQCTTQITLGMLCTPTGWRLSAASTTPEGQALLGVATQLAASIGIMGPIAIRITNRVPTTKHLMEYQACEVWGWRI
eukprot:1411821-Amphidinium_carterae.1